MINIFVAKAGHYIMELYIHFANCSVVFFVNTSFESIRKLHIRCSCNNILLVIAQYFT